jgi:hypothetical protein
VNRDKLKALPGDKLADLAKADELELLYLHLQSMRNFQALPSRLAVVKGAAAEGASPGNATADRLNGARASA